MPLAWGQIGAIVLGGVVGIVLPRKDAPVNQVALPLVVSRWSGACLLILFFVLLIGLPLLAASQPSQSLKLFDAFYRAGSLVFGGGHVVLPLLQASVVPPGWVSNDAFLAGYGAAQAVPGPLFTFSAFLGTAMTLPPNGVTGALIALVAIFLPSFLLLGAVLPLWASVRERGAVQAAVAGIGAAVVGLLGAALWDPVLRTSIHGVGDVVYASILFGLLRILPPWAVVAIAAAAGTIVF